MKNVPVSNLTIYAGSNILWSGNQTRNAPRIAVHSDYDSSTFENDIALIKLVSPLEMNRSNIGSICLPSVNSTILANGEWLASKYNCE
jgi:hypothetical protein